MVLPSGWTVSGIKSRQLWRSSVGHCVYVCVCVHACVRVSVCLCVSLWQVGIQAVCHMTFYRPMGSILPKMSCDVLRSVNRLTLGFSRTVSHLFLFFMVSLKWGTTDAETKGSPWCEFRAIIQRFPLSKPVVGPNIALHTGLFTYLVSAFPAHSTSFSSIFSNPQR